MLTFLIIGFIVAGCVGYWLGLEVALALVAVLFHY
jgi:hypothetical protein